MSRFWKYFHDSLNWPAIFSPGPLSAVAKGLALYMDDVREDILWLRRQFSPVTADDDMIARYGASRGVLRTRYDSDESYRRRVVNAFAWHKLGGKVQGLVRILAENGFAGAEILPVNDVRRHNAALSHNSGATYNAGLCWAQFDVRLEVPESGLDRDVMDWFRWLVNEYKPARSILRALSWQMRMEDRADFSDEQRLAVVPDYEDSRPWGFPLHDGSIRHDNGLLRVHNGRLAYGGTAVHTPWEPRGYRHDAQLDPLAVAVRPRMTDRVQYSPKHNAALLHDGQGRRDGLDAPALDMVKTRLSAVCRDFVPVRDFTATALNVSVVDTVGRYHDGSLSHGQRLISIRNGAFYHDGSRLRGQFGGNAGFCAMRHDGHARHNRSAAHALWGWLATAGEYAPVFTYQALSDVYAATLRMEGADNMKDAFTLSDAMGVSVMRYTLHNGKANHGGEPHYGGKEMET